jgi:hypothetical protein
MTKIFKGSMRKIIFLMIALLFANESITASTRVRSYTKKNGKHVNSYHRSEADGTDLNNYSTKGNVNPYTGKRGTKSPKGNK